MRYRTLFVGVLEQETALSVGGSDDDTSLVDSPLCRDGSGALICGGRVSRRPCCDRAKVGQSLPRGVSDGLSHSETPRLSRWRVFSSHPEGEPKPEYRQHVGLRQDTGTVRKTSSTTLRRCPVAHLGPFFSKWT